MKRNRGAWVHVLVRNMTLHDIDQTSPDVDSVGPEALQMGFAELEAFKAFEALQALQMEGLNIKNDCIHF
jgi:hypothetical protein